MRVGRVAVVCMLIGVALVPLGCHQLNVGFARFQLINHTPYNIVFYAVARTEAALDKADNLLETALGPNDVFDADVRFPGRYWLRATADVNGTPVTRTIGPETIKDGNKAWAWHMDGNEIKAGSGPRDLYAVTDLPAVVIDTHGGAVVDDPKIPADMRIAYDPAGGLNRPLSDPVDYTGPIGIEIRGNTSQTFPKKSYGYKTYDAEGEGADAVPLGFPAEEDWVLYGPWMDRSLIRNVLGYRLWGDLGYYSPRTRYVEVYLNDTDNPVLEESYDGVYVLTEKVKRDKNRVNIKKLDPEDVTEPDITGGYLLEMQGPDELDPGSVAIDVAGDFILAIEDPKPEDIPDVQRQWITGYINDFEAALFGPDFANPDTGYAAYIDVDTFVDYLLFQDLCKNRDGFRSSTWMYKDRGGKLRMGPVWDLDIAFGYFSFNGFQRPAGWYLQGPKRDLSHSPWTDRLFQDPAFVERYIARWQELRQDQFSLEHMYAIIDESSDQLHTAHVRNFVRWQSLGKTLIPDIRYLMFVGPHPDSWQGEVEYLKDWIAKRVEWMDAHIAELRQGTR